MGAPTLLFSLTGNVDLTFDDYEEIEEHPMAAPMLATFEQLFEGMMEQSPSDLSNKVLSFEKLDDEKKEHRHYKSMSMAIEGLNVGLDFLGGISEEITVSASSANFPFSASINVNSAGIGAAAKLAINSMLVPKLAKEMRYGLDVEEEDIYFEKE